MAGNMKEWFEGFIANGIQFRLDGSEITAFGVSYKIVIKNISNRVICTTGEVYFHFDNDVRKIQQIYAGIERYEDVWRTAPLKLLYECHKKDLEPGHEYFIKIFYSRTDVLTAHDFFSLELKMNNFMQLKINIADKESEYAWYVSSKKLTEHYGEYVKTSFTPNTEEDRLNALINQDFQLEKEHGVRVTNCSICRNKDNACDLLFELKEETGNCVRNLRMIVCVYNRKGKPMFLQSLDVREFEKFNIYKIKNLPIVSSKDISRIFVFPTKL